MSTTPIAPIYWDDSDFPLYSGAVVVKRPAGSITLEGGVDFRWLPTPTIKWEGATADTSAFDVALDSEANDPTIELVDATPLPPLSPLPRSPAIATLLLSSYDSGVLQPAPMFTTGAPVQQVVFNVINGPVVQGLRRIDVSGGSYAGRFVLDSPEWHFVVDMRQDRTPARERLQRDGGYAFTHVGTLDRIDGEPMPVDEVTLALERLASYLSFVRGAYVAVALPVGFDTDRQPCLIDWTTRRDSPWREGWACFDRTQAADFESLLASFVTKCHDPLWQQVLPRAFDYYVSANDPLNVEIAVSTSQMALELLAWAVLHEGKLVTTTQFKSKSFNAEHRIERLLQEAKIPLGLDPSLKHLLARSPTGGWRNGAHAITCMRNTIVHPTAKKPTFPIDAWVDAWRLSQWYLALLLLWLLDHQGGLRQPTPIRLEAHRRS